MAYKIVISQHKVGKYKSNDVFFSTFFPGLLVYVLLIIVRCCHRLVNLFYLIICFLKIYTGLFCCLFKGWAFEYYPKQVIAGYFGIYIKVGGGWQVSQSPFL